MESGQAEQAQDEALPSKKQRALHEFKELSADLIKQGDPYFADFYLQKWLIARDWNPKKAAELFRASVAYKKQMEVSTILDWYKRPEVISKYVPGGFSGHDKLGRLVRVDRYAALDMKGLVYSCRRIDLERDKLYDFEYIRRDNRQMSEKLGTRVDGLVVILDLRDISAKMLWNPGIKVYLHLVKMMEDNYPDHLRQMFVVNAPTFFSIIYQIAKPLISSEMKKKIFIFGNEEVKYQEELLKHIAAEELPAFLGGRMTDPDGNPQCYSTVKPGGEIPESYYLKDQVDKEHMEQTVVNSGSRYCVNVAAHKPGGVIKYEFMTESDDIGFGLIYQTFDRQRPERKQVVKIEKFNSHLAPEDGEYFVQEPGIYVAVFDNSYSWTKSKKLWYKVELFQATAATEREVTALSRASLAGRNWDAVDTELDPDHVQQVTGISRGDSNLQGLIQN